MNKQLADIYFRMCSLQSDINEHLPTLRTYAERCNHVTEFGVREVISTWGLMAGLPDKLISYDIVDTPIIPQLPFINKVASDNSVDFKFIKGDTLKIEIEPTDLLFIDTFHTYDQCIVELLRFHDKVSKYIIMHDTVTYGNTGEDHNQERGLLQAITGLLKTGAPWIPLYNYTHNNGLLILTRAVD